MEFLVHMRVLAIVGDEAALRTKEAERVKELAASGHVARLWRVPGRRENWGVWRARDADELHAAIASLPLFAFMEVSIHPLARHPNDPAGQADDGA